MEMLKGKVAVITGGNSGIGYATAKELKAEGAQVVITGRRQEAIAQAAQELGVTGLVADQGKVADIEKLAVQVKAQFGKVDILFINAGVIDKFQVEAATEAQFDGIMDINFRGAYFTLSKFIPLLNDGASVIFLSSNAAQLQIVGSSVYSASKAALNAVMRTAALELAPRNIRVNSVSPGPTETEIMKKTLSGTELDAVHNWLLERLPLRRIGKAADVGRMVVHLAGDSASFITGSEFIMDGGMLLG
ncbi:short-chain dehydrogenase [Chitinophaga parva]|uniref:Short-chain dehydrogenase n=1 Tax=Chitinophaga parva TaxID=2169414 RepID=A0A2T7BH29_9BACT|nr:SDR family oxidoreductase [Chitinophaga parva]PUZ25585.1 short-chain dehydrogenase [Chitinophaga parva]